MENGFAVAAAVSSFDGNPESIEDEEIGQVKFFIKSWKGALDGIDFKELKSRPCTEDDYQNTFYELREKMHSFKFFLKKMKCIDEPYEI